MIRLPTFLGLGVAAAAAVTLAGCEKGKDRTPPPAEAASAAAPGAPAAGPPMPALPTWAGEYMGKAIGSVYAGEVKICLGNTDNVQQRYGGGAPGVQIVGWGWDTVAKTPIARVLLVDKDGRVAGAGETGLDRPDVPAAKPEVTSPKSGWAAYTRQTSGPIDAYGFIDGGKAICRLGRVEF